VHRPTLIVRRCRSRSACARHSLPCTTSSPSFCRTLLTYSGIEEGWNAVDGVLKRVEGPAQSSRAFITVGVHADLDDLINLSHRATPFPFAGRSLLLSATGACCRYVPVIGPKRHLSPCCFKPRRRKAGFQHDWIGRTKPTQRPGSSSELPSRRWTRKG